MMILIGLPGIIPGISKELIMIEVRLIRLILLISAVSYSKVFSSGLLLLESMCLLLIPILLSVVVVGRMVVMVVVVMVIIFLMVVQFVVAFL
jgi:hypothetical protein